MFSNITASQTIFLADIHIPFHCEFLVAKLSAGEQGEAEISLTEVYHVHPTLSLQEFRVANWTSSNGILWLTIQRRSDLQGIKIKAGFRQQVTSDTIKSSWTIGCVNSE
jgi:hypothetical protein